MPQTREKTIIKNLLRWYATHHRRLAWRATPNSSFARPPDPYALWLAEVMAQQTSVVAAERYHQKFLRRWATFRALARASENEVLAAWAGLGYYRRARALHACARLVVREHGARLPREYDVLLGLPGIGPYTAAALCAVAFNQRRAPMDTHITRVSARLYGARSAREAAPKAQKLFDALGARQHAGDLTQALMDLGSQVCSWRKPACARCPLQRSCLAKRRGTIALCPPPLRAPKREQRYGDVFWLQRGGKVLLQRRTQESLLSGMLGFPSTGWAVRDSGKGSAKSSTKIPIKIPIKRWPRRARWQSVGAVRHVFTHFELELAVLKSEMPAHLPHPQGKDLVWLTLPQVKRAGLPSLMRKVAQRALA